MGLASCIATGVTVWFSSRRALPNGPREYRTNGDSKLHRDWRDRVVPITLVVCRRPEGA